MCNLPNVAVLGANGFVGFRLIEWLVLHQLAHIRPIVRSFQSLARLARFDLDTLDCRIADATITEELTAQLSGCEILFHCVVGDRKTILKSAEAAYRASAQAGVKRIVYLSSAVVHGHNPLPTTHDDSKLILKQPFEYNVSKIMAERLLHQLRQDGAVEVVTLRPSIVFGPRSQWFTAKIASDLLAGKAYLVEDGAGICNTIYVDNLVTAMWKGATNKEAANEDFIVTDGEKVTWKDLYTSVADAVGVDMLTVPSLKKESLLEINQILKQQEMQNKIVHPRLIRAVQALIPTRRINSLQKKFLPSFISNLSLKEKEIKSINAVLPNLDRETMSLQQCQYVLPITKAKKILGYQPSISFSEGCRRSNYWIKFAFGLLNN